MSNKNTFDNSMDDNTASTPVSSENTENKSNQEIPGTEFITNSEEALSISEGMNKEDKKDIESDTDIQTVTDLTEKENDSSAEEVNGDSKVKGDSEVTDTPHIKSKKKLNTYTIIRIICAIGFVIFTGLFINEVFIQPYRANKTAELTRELYHPIITPAPTQAPALTPSATEAAPTTDPTRDSKGRILSFKDLLSKNEDTKGWLKIPETNIDYVVMQNSADPLYYLTKDFNKEAQKAGCLFLDYHSSVEDNTKNLVIHGHNMKSTNSMFHHLIKFKKIDFYKKSPVFTFDTIYQTGQWKIFSVFITNGTSDKEPLFDYTRSTFKDDSDYMNFIYQLRVRSMFTMDTVDINENDQILCLSTCSYEINNYRTVVVARRVRDGEDPTVDVDRVTKNKKALYPETYYKNYGGEAPKLAKTFEKALDKGTINWYKPVKDKE